jgi:chemotaxis signal transduction protein
MGTSNFTSRGMGSEPEVLAPAPALAPRAERGLCAFWVGTQCFALEIGLVGELVAVDATLPVPLTRPEVIGLLNLRGTPLALVDGSMLLEVPAPAHPERRGRWALVLRAAGMVAALLIDQMDGVLSGAVAEGLRRTAEREEKRGVIEGYLEVPPREGRATYVVRVVATDVLLERLRALKTGNRDEGRLSTEASLDRRPQNWRYGDE